jgi:hypothetical protein
MSASPHQILSAIDDFLALIEEEAISPEDRMTRLRYSLDRLALLQHEVSYTFDERDYPDAPRKDYSTLRAVVAPRFPELGYYNIPGSVTQRIGEAELHVADAIDDIADIARDLYEVQWRWEHTSHDNALWYFTNSYSMHWEEHLRGLQLCLQRITAGYEETDAI